MLVDADTATQTDFSVASYYIRNVEFRGTLT